MRLRGRSELGAGLAALALTLTLTWGTGTAQAAPDPSPAGANDFSCELTDAQPRPVVLVHGLGATMDGNWSFMSPRLAAAGFCVFALTYGVDPRTESFPYSPGGVTDMRESSKELKTFVNEVLARTGARKVDLVGHSEGTVMPRWYLERRGGAKKVRKFVALTPLWRGTELGGIHLLRDLGEPFGLSQPLIDLVGSICRSCPDFLAGSDYLDDLNADGEPVPGIRHINIMTRYDELVIPYTSGIMEPGPNVRNIVIQRRCPFVLSEHALVAFDPVVEQMIENALDPASRKRPC